MSEPDARLRPPVGERDHVLGPANAAVTLVEYGDYECPYCGAAHPVVREALRRSGDAVRFAFRNFPLTQIHPYAERAAEAAEAAGAQGKFWEMHDLLYANQEHLDKSDLVAHARQIGLDVQQFTRDLDTGAFAERVREDFMSGVRSGVNGTPTFFVNGERYDGDADLAGLLGAIERAVRSS
jgi:protein-disulfide isomerase